MEVLEKLKDYRWLRVEYEQLTEEFERLKAHVEKTTQTINPQYSTGGAIAPDKIGGYVIKMDALLTKIQAKLRMIYAEMEECEEILSTLPQPYRIVMQLYYINSYTFDEVGARVGYHTDYCKKLAAQARKKLTTKYHPET